MSNKVNSSWCQFAKLISYNLVYNFNLKRTQMLAQSYLSPQICMIFLGEYGFNYVIAPNINSRFPQCCMTNDPSKVWPRGIVLYMIDSSLGKFFINFYTCI